MQVTGRANPRASGRFPLGWQEVKSLSQPRLRRAASTKSSGDWPCLPSRCLDEPCREGLLFALEDAFLAHSVQYVAVTLVTLRNLFFPFQCYCPSFQGADKKDLLFWSGIIPHQERNEQRQTREILHLSIFIYSGVPVITLNKNSTTARLQPSFLCLSVGTHQHQLWVAARTGLPAGAAPSHCLSPQPPLLSLGQPRGWAPVEAPCFIFTSRSKWVLIAPSKSDTGC